MNWYKTSQSITAYHGTCESYYRVQILEGDGLRNPYLAKDCDLAQYYAEQMSSMSSRGNYDYGQPVVLEVAIPDTNNLRYDANSMDEPVMANENDRDKAWDQAAQEHPEWVENDMIVIPETEWQISWNAVSAAKYKGIIPSEYVKRVR